MEKESHNNSVEHANNTEAQPVLRTDVTLCEDDLSEEAKEQFVFHTEILSTFQRNARIILSNDRLTPIGRHLFCTSIEKHYRNCKDVLNYVASHPALQTTANPLPPLFILCGAGRTGSTLLYNLLACDPASRAPSLLDMTYPVPPIGRLDTAAQVRRNSIARTSTEKLEDLVMTDHEQERNASHPCYTYEEDIFILFQGDLSMPYLEPRDSTELMTWFYDETNKDFVYEYHKTFIQMLNSVDTPQSHWLLKAPIHSFYLDTLLRHYPSAHLIMTHRRLQDVVPSSVRLGLADLSIFFDSSKHDAMIDRQMIVEHRLRVTDVQINRIIKFRRAHPQVPVFDVLYDELFTKPIDIVRRIYDQFGLTWSEEFEQAMLVWLQENPQGKQGRNTYTLEEFGLTHDVIEQRYEDYIKMFLNPREPLKTNIDTIKSTNSASDNVGIVTDCIQ